MATRLLILVPGYEVAAKRNEALISLRDGVSAVCDGATISPATRGGSSGWAIAFGGHSVEVYEAFWQDQIQMLSDNKLYIRVLTGLWISLLWLNPRTLSALRRSFMWLLATLGGSLLLALWLYGGIAVLLVSLGNLVPASMSLSTPSGGQLDVHALLQSRVASLGIHMQQFWLWAWASIILALAGIRLDAFANVLDLVRRFVTNSLDGLFTVRQKLSRVVKHAVDGLAQNTDEKIVLVGHSFGVLVAMDAIAGGLEATIDFVSFGSFLAFLSAEFRRVRGDIAKCSEAPRLSRWQDYYSSDDWYAGPLPIPTGADKITSQCVTGYIPFYERFLVTAHGNYYDNPDAMGRLADVLFK